MLTHKAEIKAGDNTELGELFAKVLADDVEYFERFQEQMNPYGWAMGMMGMPGMMPYGMGMPGMGMNPFGGMGMGMMGMGGTNDVKVVGSKERPLEVVCKAIDMRDVNVTANNRLETILVQELKDTGLFDYNETKRRELKESEQQELADVKDDKGDEGKPRLKTYMFGLNLVLRDPIEL